MADSRVQLEAEDWVRTRWLPQRFGQSFDKKRLLLVSGGVFEFDAVSTDRAIVASISTSGATTARGKNAVGKFMKIRSDMYFLMLVDAPRRVVVLTEADMFEACQKENEAGRIPDCIEFVHAQIPNELRTLLTASRLTASLEVSRPLEDE